MEYEIINNIDKQYNFKEDTIDNIITSISKKENKKFNSLNIIISNDSHLNHLKKEYFNKDHFTDIITFNLEDKGHPIEGEIYISMDRIEENSNDFGNSFESEFKRIFIHGLLHLFGYNDQTIDEKKNMTKLEDYYLNKYKDKIIS
tara:strand:+ start:3699 stop:4133 length:435 start_codon:yes stop_codon:yes gene_type:complete